MLNLLERGTYYKCSMCPTLNNWYTVTLGNWYTVTLETKIVQKVLIGGLNLSLKIETLCSLIDWGIFESWRIGSLFKSSKLSLFD